jgi:dephospho-CoA kinase
MTNLNLIGIGGTDGSGKDSLGEMLQERHGWLFVSVTDILRGELNNRGISLRRENLRSLGDEWRRAYGPGVLVAKALEIYEKQTKKYNGLVLASMRNPGEADTLHNEGGILVWVDADPEIRYRRVTSRSRGSEDVVSFEQFMAEHNIQSSGNHEAEMNLIKVKDKSDVFIENNGNDIEKFKKEAEKALKKYL